MERLHFVVDYQGWHNARIFKCKMKYLNKLLNEDRIDKDDIFSSFTKAKRELLKRVQHDLASFKSVNNIIKKMKAAEVEIED